MPLTREFRRSRANLKHLACNRFDPNPAGGVATFISRSTASITINGQSYAAASPQYTWSGGNLSMVGGNPVSGGSGSGVTAHVNAGTIASPSYRGNPHRWRFRTAAPQILIHTLGFGGSNMRISVDGKFTSLGGVDLPIDTFGDAAVSLIDLGAWPATQEVASSPITAGGSGYARGDIFTISGGTGTAASGMVTAVSAGAVTGIQYMERGSYSVTPTPNPLATTTSGSGTGLTLSPTWRTKFGIRNRLIELHCTLYTRLIGVSVGPDYTALPVPAVGPRCVFGVDSQSEDSYNLTGGQWWMELGRAVGLDDLWGYAVGSHGWTTANAFANRIPDIIANGCDIGWFTGSSNDGAAADATITAAVYSGFKALRAGLPNALLIGSSPWNSPGAILSTAKNDAFKAGIDQANAEGADIKWVDTKAWTTNGRYIGGGSGTGSSSWKVGHADGTHYNQQGHSENAQLAAEALRSILAAA